MDHFKYFLLNEERGYLGHRVNDVLTSIQDLQDDIENLGSRHLSRLAEDIVNQIRKILHSQWAPRSHKHLEELQKIAVAIQKTIDDKGDLREVIPSVMQNLQTLAGQLGVKVNDLQAPEIIPGEDIDQSDFELTGDGEQPPPAEQPPQPGQPPMPQPGPAPMPGQSQPPMPQ